MSNAFFLLWGVDRASIILRGDGSDGWGCEPHSFALKQNTRSSGLEGRQSTGDQALALGPATGFHSSLSSLPDLGRFHVGQQQAAFSFFFFSFAIVSNLLFVLVYAVDEERRMLGRKLKGRNKP